MADAIDFPHNCDPDLFADKKTPVYADMYLRRPMIFASSEILSASTGTASGVGATISTIDAIIFAYIDHPLTFDQQGRVCIHTQFTNYELFDAYRQLISNGGLFHEAAGMKEYRMGQLPNQPAGQERSEQFFLASLVASGWQEGSFKPIGLGGFDFERMVVGRGCASNLFWKHCRTQGRSDAGRHQERLAKTTAYTVLPARCRFQYFYPQRHPRLPRGLCWYSQPNVDKQLWDKYEAANLAIRLAGWEPVTHATANASQFSFSDSAAADKIYLTAWGPEPPASVEIEVDAAALGLKEKPSFSEIVSDTPMQVEKSSKGWKLTLPMEKIMTRVIRIR